MLFLFSSIKATVRQVTTVVQIEAYETAEDKVLTVTANYTNSKYTSNFSNTGYIALIPPLALMLCIRVNMSVCLILSRITRTADGTSTFDEILWIDASDVD